MCREVCPCPERLGEYVPGVPPRGENPPRPDQVGEALKFNKKLCLLHEMDPRHNPFDFTRETEAAPKWIAELLEVHESLPWQRRNYLRGAMLDKLRPRRTQ